MSAEKRGRIRDRDRAAQIRDFTGIRLGNITPTDVDGLIEYRDKLFILFELKFQDNELPGGQRLALERLVNAINKPAIVFIGRHMQNIGDDISAAEATVTEYFWRGKWHQCEPLNLADAIQRFINKHDKGISE